MKRTWLDKLETFVLGIPWSLRMRRARAKQSLAYHRAQLEQAKRRRARAKLERRFQSDY